MNENEEKKYTETEMVEARRDAWNEADLAHHSLVFEVEQYVDNGGDTWGRFDDALEAVQALRNPYAAADGPAPEPPMFAGTQAALDALTIRPAVSS